MTSTDNSSAAAGAPPTGPSRPTSIRLTFVDDALRATVALLWEAAPRTCQALVDALPVAGLSHHATYSGSEAVLVLPELIRVEPEHATADVSVGDVAFTWFDTGDAYGVTAPFSEIAWFYDRDARPSMHEGPAPMSVFGRLEGSTTAFYERCRAMRRRGVTAVAVEIADPDGPDVDVQVVHRAAPATGVGPPLLAQAGSDLLVAFTTATTDADVDPSSAVTVLRSRDQGDTWEVEPVVPHRRGIVASAWRNDPSGLVLDIDTFGFAPDPASPRGWSSMPTGTESIAFGAAGVLAGTDFAPTNPTHELRTERDQVVIATPNGIHARVHSYPGIPADAATGLVLDDGRIAIAYRAWDAPPDSDPPIARRTIRFATIDPRRGEP